MKHEAKFSVILPAGNYASAQIETFEQVAIRYNLPVTLPLNTDLAGNLIVASSLSLRDAQLLRRQVAGLGFPADCVSDASESQFLSPAKGPAINTLVVGAVDVQNQPTDSVGELASDAWSSLEMPSSLDLGLSDAADVSGVGRWNESNWLEPDEYAIPEETPTKESTLGMSAMELFSAAQAANKGTSSSQSLNAVNILGNKKPAIVHSAKSAPKMDIVQPQKPGFPQYNSSVDNRKTMGLPAPQQMPPSDVKPSNMGAPLQIHAAADNRVQNSQASQQKIVPTDQASVLPVVPQPTSTAPADFTKTAAITAPQNLIVSTENKTTAIKAPQSTPEADSNPVAAQTTADNPPAETKEVATENTTAPVEHREKSKIPASVIFAWILIFIVTICLVIAIFYAYVEPKEMLSPLLKPVL